MAIAWYEYSYPQLLELERVEKGVNRCQTPGAARICDLNGIVESSLVVHPTTREPLTTARIAPPGARVSPPTPPGSEVVGSAPWIFAVRRGVMRLHPDGGRREDRHGLPEDAVKHESLFANRPVSAAGEIELTNGIVTAINDASGTYQCDFRDSDFRGAVLEALRASGATISEGLSRLLS